MRNLICLIAVLLLACLILSGCPKPEEAAPPTSLSSQPPPATTTPAADKPAPAETKAEPKNTTKPAAGENTVLVIKTVKGAITVELFDKQVPLTAGNFLLLAESGFYNGLSFHRYEPDFVIQGGDPNGDGSGGPGFSIPDETGKGFKHERGILSMAKSSAPDSAGSQFFIIIGPHENAAHLDQDFSPFGKVLDGMSVADKIRPGDEIEKITVKSVSPNAEKARQAAKAARKPD